MSAAELQNILDSGSAAAYYVSDAALPAMTPGAANAPSAWMVIDPSNQLCASERSALNAIAPVATSVAALAALPNNPLVFPKGMTGFGFFDQKARLILVASNPSTLPGAAAISGQISLSGTGFADGRHKVTDLFTGATRSLSFTGGKASFARTVNRWETLVFAIDP